MPRRRRNRPAVRDLRPLPTINTRQHFTRNGRPKRIYSPMEIKAVLADRENLVSYRCEVCGKLHVGNG